MGPFDINAYVTEKQSNIFKIVKERKYEPRISCPTKLAFKYKGHKNGYQHSRTQEICSPEILLSNLLENKLQTSKMTREILT